jgi:hypothetical protein
MYVLRLLPLVLLIAATPIPQHLRDRLIAEAAAIAPEQLAFDRTTKSVRTGGGTTTKINLVERWDGTKWTLLSIAGAKPTSTQRHDHEERRQNEGESGDGGTPDAVVDVSQVNFQLGR